MMEWERIEGYPKDGTVVDVWHAEYGRITDTWWDEGHIVSCPDGIVTHFMVINPPALKSDYLE